MDKPNLIRMSSFNHNKSLVAMILIATPYHECVEIKNVHLHMRTVLIVLYVFQDLKRQIIKNILIMLQNYRIKSYAPGRVDHRMYMNTKRLTF